MSHSAFDIDDSDLSGLTEEQLKELSEYIDPENELLPASERVPGQTSKKASGPYDRPHLLTHLKKQAEESRIGEDYVPFVKKTSPREAQSKKQPAPSQKPIVTEFDEMLGLLDEDDMKELASELGIHSLLDQAGSRGDEPVTASPHTGLHRAAADYRHSPATSKPSEDPQDTDIEEAIVILQENDPSLRELNLNNHPMIDSDLIDQVIDALSDNTQLTKLHMVNVKFSEDHAIVFAEKVLRTNRTLTVVNLESNRITSKGIKPLEELSAMTAVNSQLAIMRAIAENKDIVLRELRLVNQYYPGGARAEADIAKYLEKNMTIVKLGYNFTQASYRTNVDRFIMRNTDLGRKKRASITV